MMCPISFERMVDPVVASDGHTYEREQQWFDLHNTTSQKQEKASDFFSLNIKPRFENIDYGMERGPDARYGGKCQWIGRRVKQ